MKLLPPTPRPGQSLFAIGPFGFTREERANGLCLPLKGGGNQISIRRLKGGNNTLCFSPSPLEGEGWGGGCCAAIALFLLALFFAAPAMAADKVKISYVVPVTEYADLLLGYDAGYFAEEGLDVELVQAGGGVATPALTANDLDFTGSPGAAISAILKGAKLKVLFITNDRAPYLLWAQADIKAVADLKGKTVGVITRGDTTEIAMRYFLVKEGFPSDYVSFTPLGTGTARLAALASGAYPATILGVIETAQLQSSGRGQGLHQLADFRHTVHMTFSGIATSDKVIASRPDVVRRAMRAALKGIALAKLARDATIDSIMKHGNQDRPSAGVDYDATAPELTDTGTMPDEDQAFELKLRGELLGVPPEKIAKIGDVFDFSFVRKAAAELKAENWKPKTGSRSP
jgi:NitT/TauT family transport system substrate-binding protein